MNHLPQKNAEHIQVPFVARRIIFTPDDFFSLPQKYNCSGEQLVQEGPSLLREFSVEIAPAFLQEWLFFSLLAQILNKDVDSRQFFKEQRGMAEVDTSGIMAVFEDSHQQLSSGDGQDRNHRTRAIIALDEARSFVLAWCSDKYLPLGATSNPNTSVPPANAESDFRFWEEYPVLSLSFGIMGETLDRFCARNMQWPLPRNGLEPYGGWGIKDERSWGVSNHLCQRMIANGWCPHEVRRIGATTGDLSSMYYISSFQPVTHQEHSRCEDVACHLDPWEEFKMHSDNCPSATHADRLLLDEDELVRIITAGNIPLLSLDDETNVILTEHVPAQTSNGDNGTAERAEERFVAISHVWSDGLGPSDGKGLPICQLTRIRHTLMKNSDLEGPDLEGLPFWIDSLCIPMRPDIRSKAFQMMGEIYSQAYTVLVLDSTLRLTSVHTSQLDAIIRINTGIWCTRMWTLPEGVQARNVHFDFEDGLLSIRHLRRHYRLAKHNPLHPEHYVYKAGWVFSPSIFLLRHEIDADQVAQRTAARPDCKSTGHLWLSMQWRRTDRREDETLCLARLLDLDPLPILRTSAPTARELAEKRMVEFLDLMDQRVGIPPGMIFLPGPRLPVRGFGWAPASWMTKRSREAAAPLFVAEQRLSLLTRRGLQVRYPGIRLHPGRSGDAVGPRFWIPLDPTPHHLRRWLRVSFAPDSPAQAGDWDTKVWATACAGAELPCIIRSRFEQHAEPEMALLVRGLSRRHEALAEGAVRVAGQNREDVFWVQTLCRVRIQRETDSAVVAKHVEDFRLRVDMMTWGETLDGDQRWVVDGEV